MINLIPKAGKKKILLEYWARVVSVWFLVWSVTLLACASIVFPVYVLIGAQINAYEESTVAVTEKLENIENISPELKAATTQARRIVNEAGFIRLSDLVTLFNRLQGDGVKLTDIKLIRNDNDVILISLEGMSDNRQTLSSFRDRLLAEPEIKAVNLPISNLEQDRNIKFSLTVDLNNTSDI